MRSIYLPNTIKDIGAKAFYNCTALSEIDLPDGLLSLGTYALYGTAITSITFPKAITSIPSYCCYDCRSLSEIKWAPYSMEIGSYSFYGCTALKTLDIPNSITLLGNYAFHGCTEIDTLYIGTGLEYILDYSRVSSVTNPSRYADTAYEYYPLLWEDGPSEMKYIIVKDDDSEFRVRGYGHRYQTYLYKTAYPLFSNMNVVYYYIGRPLKEIKSWNYSFSSSTYTYEISSGKPYGTIQTLEIGGRCTDVPYFYQSVEYLILGEDVKTYTISNIYQDNMKGIICRSMTPPTLDSKFDISTYVNVVLYVPSGSKNAYQSTLGWSDFWDIVELETMPSGYTAIEDIATNAQTEAREIYTINGQRLNSPQRGINILRYVDGTSKKIIVK